MSVDYAELLVFDGDCGFCTFSAEWVARGWPPGPRAVAWQHLGADGLKAVGLTPAQAQEAVWWVDGMGHLFKGHRAVGKSLTAGRGPKRAVGIMISLAPLSWVAAAVYPLIVRYRYRLPGGTPACRVIAPDERTATSVDQ